MFKDQRGLTVTAANEEAVRAFDDAMDAYLSFGNDTASNLKRALEADPDMPLALTARGCLFKLFATRFMDGKAAASLAEAQAAVDARQATARERRHVEALRLWCAGDFAGAVGQWDTILIDHPRDVLALKLAHYMHFYLGSAEALRDSVTRTLDAWDEGVPGYGFILGCHAFGLEEAGHYEAAEAAGRRAIALNPADVWATHAVAHVMEMQGRQHDGIAWLDGLKDNWGKINHFIYHVWWHKALMHLDIGQHDEALSLYDSRIRADQTEDYLDISNGASLLWRMEQEGVDVGDRWQELGEHALPRLGDHNLVFADAHYLMAFAASGRGEAVSAMLQSLKGVADDGTGTEADIVRSVGLPLMDAVVAARAGQPGRVVDLLLPVRYDLKRIGGSHAQRDLFHRMLIEAAIADGRLSLARALIAERLPLRPNHRWTWRRYADTLSALGDTVGANAAASRLTTLDP